MYQQRPNDVQRLEDVYPPELSLTSDDATEQANYLDLSIAIKNGKIHTSLFDKRDAFEFTIVNFPDLSGNIPRKQSYGVFVSQLIRYCRCCQDLEDFRNRTRKLVDRLVRQNFSLYQLARTFEKFAESNYELLFKYGVHVCFMSIDQRTFHLHNNISCMSSCYVLKDLNHSTFPCLVAC